MYNIKTQKGEKCAKNTLKMFFSNFDLTTHFLESGSKNEQQKFYFSTFFVGFIEATLASIFFLQLFIKEIFVFKEVYIVHETFFFYVQIKNV
jgi:hypothetical protein